MNVEQPKPKLELSKSLINLEDHQYLRRIMDVRRTGKTSNMMIKNINNKSNPSSLDYKNNRRPSSSFSQGQNGKSRMFRYFTLESLFLLVCLTVSLLILPLVLPPLPPPPFMLLLLPVFILGLLMVLAFTPSDSRDVTHTFA